MIPTISSVISCIGFAIWAGIDPSPEPIVMLCLSASSYALFELKRCKHEKEEYKKRIQIAQQNDELINKNEAQARELKNKQELINHHEETLSKLSKRTARVRVL